MLHSPIRSEREVLEDLAFRSALERKQAKKEQLQKRVKSIFDNLKHSVFDKKNKQVVDEDVKNLLEHFAIAKERQKEEEKKHIEIQQKENGQSTEQELDEQFMQFRNLDLIDM